MRSKAFTEKEPESSWSTDDEEYLPAVSLRLATVYLQYSTELHDKI